MRLVKGLGQKAPGAELRMAMRRVYGDDECRRLLLLQIRFECDAGWKWSGHARREGGKLGRPQKYPGPPRKGTCVLSITWIDTVRITASRFGSCVGNLDEKGKGQKAIDEG